jgi:hypothetical protein
VDQDSESAETVKEMQTGDVETLRELEEGLWRAETRFDRTFMERILHPAFFEFGRSGRTYTREQTLDAAPVNIDAELPLRDFAVDPVDDDVVLVTYVSVVRCDAVEMGNRSSLWVRKGDSWVLRFHQGTSVPN